MSEMRLTKRRRALGGTWLRPLSYNEVFQQGSKLSTEIKID